MEDESNKSGLSVWLWLLILVGFVFFISNYNNGNLQTREEFNNSVAKPNPVTNFSSEDRNTLTMLVLCEAANEPSDCKSAIAATVLNRVEEQFGSTVTAVITAPNQFGPYYNGSFYVGGCPVTLDYFSEDQIKSAESAIDSALIGRDPTKPIGGSLYYYNWSALSDEERQASRNPNSLKFGSYVFFRDWN